MCSRDGGASVPRPPPPPSPVGREEEEREGGEHPSFVSKICPEKRTIDI